MAGENSQDSQQRDQRGYHMLLVLTLLVVQYTSPQSTLLCIAFIFKVQSQTEPFHPLIHPPKGCASQGKTGQKPGVRNSIQSLT